MSFLWILAGIAIVVLAIFLEGRRQERKLGRKSSARPGLLGGAMLEIQRAIEPERHVETLVEEAREVERVLPGERNPESGDGDDEPPAAAGSGPSAGRG